MAKELKRIDLNAGSFVANGTTYYIESALSIERFAEYQILEKEAGFSLNFKNIFQELKKVYDLLNGVKFVEASVSLHNLMTGVAKLEEREPTLLKICALFMNTKDEDRATINNDMIVKKIEDWKQEYEIRDFFSFALSTVNGFTEIYAIASQLTSESISKSAQKGS